MGNLSCGRFVNPNNSAFQTAVNSEIYVDKTGLLKYTNKVLGTKQAFICNSRPRRFGKSVTADNQAVQDEYINFLRGLFKGTEPTKYIHLAYLTGILLQCSQ
jgi:hypothetical protein